MKKTQAKKAVERESFYRKRPVIDFPNLIGIQTESYREFLQVDVMSEDRKNVGLQSLFNEVFPIKSYNDNCSLEFVSYSIGVPKYDVLECQRRGMTFGGALKVLLRLTEGGNVKEESVYLGILPLMTAQGTFVINGAERVIVSQLHRSPGICFEAETHLRGQQLYKFRVIPYRGSWLEAQFDINDCIFFYVDRKKRRRKMLATTFLRALGYSTDAEILEQFYEKETIKIKKSVNSADIEGRILGADVIDPEDNTLMAKAGQVITPEMGRRLLAKNVDSLVLLKGITEDSPVLRMLAKDPSDSQESALKDIYKRLRPGDPPTLANAKALIKKLFFDVRRYDIGRVGRYKLNKKLGLEITEEELAVTTLKTRDIVESLKYLINLRKGEGLIDDIDHLGNRRVRSIGELVQAQCRVGMARIERIVKERMNFYDQNTEMITPQKLINPKGFSAVVKDFFGRSQLSQFMDQTNVLSELTHKRRLSALGPGGLSRSRAGFEVRDVHPSHYGRICPIETPEGPNIGLISSLAAFARVNEFGFIESPYRKVVGMKVTNDVEYLTADVEENCIIAQSDTKIGENHMIVDKDVSVRYKGDFIRVTPEKVQYIEISPLQLVSIAAGLIPFLEHDDANRALMGSNMQRQGVPLLAPEAPIVATGIERRCAVDSGVMILAEEDGEVEYVDSRRIVVAGHEYVLRKNMRSNACTCINQRPIVKEGDPIKKGDVLADGQSTQGGEVALGRNVLCAFMPWGGYNFEDAILVSEKVVKEDVYTSIHIEEFEIASRDTKLGREEITRDIPNVSEEALANLGTDGIIRIGAEVKPGDILVGKITPKGETELSPEERLLRAIFGEKAADVKDASLVVPTGISGVVIDVKVFSRKEKAKTESEKQQEKTELKQLEIKHKERVTELKRLRKKELTEMLLKLAAPSDIVDAGTGEIIVQSGDKIGPSHLAKLETREYRGIEIEDEGLRVKLRKALARYDLLIEEADTIFLREEELVKKGDELEPGLIKQVKVYIASKRKLSVGDKMAGRHGNKGVIAKILPEEDMPYLPDGTPVEIVLNPLGVPSRMNVGQVLETHLGWACKVLGIRYETPVFEGITEDGIHEILKKAGLPADGKTVLFDGRTGDRFDQEVVVGFIYMLKLNHLVADKIHARSIGPYSLVTQQPLGGKAQFGGQRFGEMEVWALEAYGAAYTLQEMLTVKSDDVQGRTKIYESIVKGENSLHSGTPESFNVLIKEMQSLCLDVSLEKN